MIRRYATPAAFKHALEQRLRAAAEGDGMELARRRQLLVFDRLLARLDTKLGDHLVLKGGLVVELRLARARTTKDVDIRVDCRPDQVLPILQEAGRLDLDDFLRFEVTPDTHHPEIDVEGMRYQGQRYRVQAMLAAKIYGSAFGLDVAFEEPTAGEVEVATGSDMLDFVGIPPSSYRIYPLEAHVAEKLHAYTMPRARPNSRVKDLPDIALLATSRTMEGTLLRRAIVRTFEARATHTVPQTIPTPPEDWQNVYERMAKLDRLPWTTLTDLVSVVSSFLDPVLSGRTGTWDPKNWSWTG